MSSANTPMLPQCGPMSMVVTPGGAPADSVASMRTAPYCPIIPPRLIPNRGGPIRRCFLNLGWIANNADPRHPTSPPAADYLIKFVDLSQQQRQC